jgi:apolipoprotein N-acyltransferase
VKLPLQILAAISVGLLLRFVSPPVNVGGNLEAWLHFIAFVPLLAVMDPTTQRRNTALAYLAGFVTVFACFHWITESIIRFSNLPTWFAYVCLVGYSAAFAIPYAVAFAFVQPLRKRFGAWWVLLFPCVQVAVEFAFPALFPYYQGVSQYRTPLTYGIASVFGITSVTWMIFAVNCALTEVIYWLREDRKGSPWVPAGAVAAAFVATLIFGGVRANRLAKEIDAWPTICVSQLQQSITMEERMHLSPRQAMLDWYRQSNELVGQDVDLVVWPEGATPYDPRGGRVGELMAALARNLDAPILFGGGFAERKKDPNTGRAYTEQRNSIYLMDASGELVQRYDKMVPLPFGEYLPGADLFPILKEWIKGPGDFEAGTVPVVFEIDTDAGPVELTTPICYEAILAPFVRRNLSDAQLFVNVTNDGWFGDTPAPHQHAMLAAVRTMELGIPMVRTAYTGISMVVLPDGRIQNETAPFTDVVQVIEVPLGTVTTIYSRIGDVFSWICLLAALGSAGVLWRDKRNAKSKSAVTGTKDPS